MSDETILRWGILGCGDVTEVKSGPGFRKASRSALTRVMRRDAGLAEDYARRHGVPGWTASADALIAADDVDAVYIATPPDTHAAYALAVAAAGKPILVEKPLANCLADAERMVAACEDAGVPLFCAYYRRSMPKFRAAKAFLEDGVLGTPTRVVIRHATLPPEDRTNLPWRLRPGAGDGGIFMDMGSHMIDLVQYLVGPARLDTVVGRASTTVDYLDVPDTVTAQLTLSGPAGAVPVEGSWSYVADAPEDRIEIVCTAGRLAFSVFDGSPLVTEIDGREEQHAAPHPDHVHQPMIEDITRAVLDGGTTVFGGHEALRTARVQARILGTC